MAPDVLQEGNLEITLKLLTVVLLANFDPPFFGVMSVGRAPALQAGCQEFESP